MRSLSYNVRISKKDGYRPLIDFATFGSSPHVSEGTQLSDRIFGASAAERSSPLVEYGLSLEELNDRVILPIASSREVMVGDGAIPYGAMERVEIMAEGTDSDVPTVRDRLLGDLRIFEYSGADVSSEFIKNIPAWGPKIGLPERPEAIPVNQFFERLVTNENLRQATEKRFLSRNFADAVEAAFKCLNNAVKAKSGHVEKDGADLMRHVFSANAPQLQLNALQSQSDKDDQNGYREIFAGVMTGIRNPRAHEHELTDNPAVALELLAMANHLMRRLENATRVNESLSRPPPS